MQEFSEVLKKIMKNYLGHNSINPKTNLNKSKLRLKRDGSENLSEKKLQIVKKLQMLLQFPKAQLSKIKLKLAMKWLIILLM